MPLHMQAKLLRVLQENQIIRVGGKDIIDIDVRIISATNKDLLHECKNGNFREDLYYRLNVLYIVLPPLRERKEDIEELVYHFIKKINNKIGSNIEGVSPEVIDYFMKYDWPGNVRELENILERAINFLDGDLVIRPQHLPSKITGITRYREIDSLKSILEEVEKQTIIDSLIIAKGNKTLAANMLKISRTSLYEKIMKYNIDI